MFGVRCISNEGFPGGSVGKNLPIMQEMRVQCLGLEDPLEEGIATHSSILACRITMDRVAWQNLQLKPAPRGFPGGSDGEESAYSAGDLKKPWRRECLPRQYSCLENPMGRGGLVGCSPWGCKESETAEQLTLPSWGPRVRKALE